MWWNFLVIKFQMKVLGVTIFDIILFFYFSCVACICINTWWKLKRFFIFCCSFFFYGCGFICLEFGSEELLIWDAHTQNFAINVEFQVLLKFLLGSGNTFWYIQKLQRWKIPPSLQYPIPLTDKSLQDSSISLSFSFSWSKQVQFKRPRDLRNKTSFL